MARKRRVHYPGAVYHVMLLGNGGHEIFFDEQDRFYFGELLSEGLERFYHRIHGFCLMNHHVHLVIQVGGIELSRIIQNVSFRYTRWINKRQKRMGHFFQGRYKAILVDADRERGRFPGFIRSGFTLNFPGDPVMLVVCTFDILKKPLKNPDVLNSIKGTRREEFWEMITSRKRLYDKQESGFIKLWCWINSLRTFVKSIKSMKNNSLPREKRGRPPKLGR